MKGKESRKGLGFRYVFLKRLLNKGAAKHPNLHVLHSLQCAKGLYDRVAFSWGAYIKSMWERTCFPPSEMKCLEEPQHAG